MKQAKKRGRVGPDLESAATSHVLLVQIAIMELKNVVAVEAIRSKLYRNRNSKMEITVTRRLLMGRMLSFVCCLSVLAISPAFADTLDYVLTGPTDTITFSLSQTPTALACGFSTSCFSVNPVTVTIDGSPVTAEVDFYLPANGGGLAINQGNTDLINQDGPGSEQLFTGTLASPTLETFTNLQLTAGLSLSPQYNEAFVLNVTDVSGVTGVPEPSAVALLLTAMVFGLIGLRVRRAAA